MNGSKAKVPAVFCPTVVEANGDGYTVKAGKPFTRITPKQLASQFGVDRSSVYRWRNEGIIPDRMIHRAGIRKIEFDAEVIVFLQEKFLGLHE